MDLVGLLLIVVVLVFGSFYAAWIFWSIWREARSMRERTRSNGAPTRESTWVQHLVTLVLAFIFLSAGATMCVSMLHGESQTRAVRQLKLLFFKESVDTDVVWGEKGNRGSLHYARSPGGKRVTGASMAYIKFDDSDLKRLFDEYPSIKWLVLSGTQIDDRALELLAQRANLTALVLTDTAITDDGLVVFQGHPQIHELALTRTAITDKAVEIADSMPALEHLNLRQTAVSDAGLAELAGNTTLRTLNIQATRITDAAVPTLASIENLASLQVANTGLSPQGILELHRALPNCEITPSCW